VRFALATKEMGLAPGGLIKQRLYSDEYEIDDWQSTPAARCFVRLIHCADWTRLTGCAPPHEPITEREYQAARLPWFSEYSEGTVVHGSGLISRLKSFLGSPPPPPFNVPDPTIGKEVLDVATGKRVVEGRF